MVKGSLKVIIVNLNGLEYLPDCLGSLSLQEYSAKWDILVVDNGSSDGSIEYIRKNFPEVGIIENGENFGFTKANNIGIEIALREGCEYVVLLNQDTIVEKGWLRELVKATERDKKIGSVQSKILLYPEKGKINSYGNEIHFLGFGFCGYYRQDDGERFTQSRKAAYASGASVLLKTEVLRETGLLDEYFFMYHEDLNLGWRLLLAGYVNITEPKSVVYHKYTFTKGSYKYYWMEKNRHIVILQNYSLKTLILILPVFLIMETGLLFFSVKAGFLKEKFKAYGYFLLPSSWSLILKTRRIRQKERKITDGELLEYFSGTIDFEDIKSPLLDKIVNPLLSSYFRILKKLLK